MKMLLKGAEISTLVPLMFSSRLGFAWLFLHSFSSHFLFEKL